MAGANARLEAIFAHFAGQPGVSEQVVAQLRSAACSDAGRLDQLNRLASSGKLAGFALEVPGAAQGGAVGYDKTNGMITLPSAGFRPGAAAGRDLEGVLGLHAIIAEFAHRAWQDSRGQQHAVSQDMVDNLQRTLEGSPALADQTKTAILLGHVQHFSLLGSGMAAGATYDGSTTDGSPRGINLPPEVLQTRSPANPRGRYDVSDLTFVLGHEIQHGFNDAAKDRATARFLHEVQVQADSPERVHDYSDELRAYLQAGRDDEARAQIAGWNALLSREQQRVPGANLDHMLFVTRNDRVRDFVEPANSGNIAVASAKPGLTFNPDGSLSQTPANIAAMGQHYFDRPSRLYAQPGERPVSLGEHRPAPAADYTNYYGTWAVERIIAAEERANARHHGVRPQIAIDMAGLGLKEDLIEMEGLDLGANRSPRPYLDTSRTPAAPGRFHHTQDASMGHDHQHVPVVAHARIRPSGDPVVDAWIDALQDGDDLAARTAQRALVQSIEAQRARQGARDAGIGQDARQEMAGDRSLHGSPLSGDLGARIAAEAMDSGLHAQPGLQHAMER